LVVKRQDIYQLEGETKQLRDQMELNEEEVRKIVSRSNSYRQLSEEHKAEAQARTTIIN
jgi:flagellar biosynthesis chaperone FliJ